MNFLKHTLTACTAALLLLTTVAATGADKSIVTHKVKRQGMESRLFRSAVDTKGHLTVDGTAILPHNRLSLGLTLDFGFNGWPAPELPDDTSYNRTVLDTYIYSIFMFNWGIKDMIVIGLGVPIVLPTGTAFNGYDDNSGDPVKAGWSTSGGIGDIELHAKLRWIRADRHPVGLGTVIQYQFPSGEEEFLAGDPWGGALRAKMILDVEPVDWYRGAINLGIHLPLGALGGQSSYLNNIYWTDGPGTNAPERLLFKYGPMMNFGIGNSFAMWPGVMDFVVEVYGSHLLTEFKDRNYLSMEGNVGVKLYVERSSYLMAGYAHGIPVSGKRGDNDGYGFQSVEHRMFIGFAYEPSIGDRDGDGIKDDLDQCPDDPEDFDGFLDSDGCPDPDNDQDGIPDVRDDCPLVPEDHDGDQDDDGCPERTDGDRDGDGILDKDDQCPDDPEDLDGFEDEDGCPDPDNDYDGILDVEDKCPNEAEDFDGFQDDDGCPDPDNDGDRIPDVIDKCPNDPETYNGKDDEDGCPDQGDVVLEGNTIRILKKVYFEYDSATIQRVSFDILDAVAETIKNNPQIGLVEISRHADENGSDEYNLKLTTDRAASVKTYLLKKGVNPDSITSMGYGEYCPVELDHNVAAWEKNRRVEFKVLVNNGVPTGARRGCEAAVKNNVVAPPLNELMGKPIEKTESKSPEAEPESEPNPYE